MANVTNGISKLCTSILELFTRNDYKLEKFLNPGLRSSKIDDELRKIDLIIPQELREIYLWRNGTFLNEDILLEQVYIFPPCYYFMSFNDAIITYLDLADAEPHENNWFPFLTDEGGSFFLIECNKNNEGRIFFNADEGNFLCSNSLYDLLFTLKTAFEEGAVFINSEETLDFNFLDFGKVGKRTNPSMNYWDIFYSETEY